MTTTDQVLLIVLTSLIGLFFLILITIAVMAVRLLMTIKRVVAKAEDVVESVESATEVLRDTHGRMALFKLVKNIVKLVQRSRK